MLYKYIVILLSLFCQPMSGQTNSINNNYHTNNKNTIEIQYDQDGYLWLSIYEKGALKELHLYKPAFQRINTWFNKDAIKKRSKITLTNQPTPKLDLDDGIGTVLEIDTD